LTYVDFVVVAAAAIAVVDAAVASKPCFDILYCEFVNGILIRWDETFFQRKKNFKRSLLEWGSQNFLGKFVNFKRQNATL